MPSKLLTFCYVHNFTQRVTQDYTIKDITGIVKLSDIELAKIVFLCIKAFIPINQNIESKIDPFEIGNTILLNGKFVPFENYYIVCPFNTDFPKIKKPSNRSSPYFFPQQGQCYFY